MSKQKFAKSIGDISPSVSFEEMGGAAAQEEINAIEVVDYEEETPVLEKSEPKPSFEIPAGSFLINQEALNEAIQKGIEEKLKSIAPAPAAEPVQKTEITSRKVESNDDLPEFRNWEEKDRTYILCSGYSSLSQGIKDRHKRNSPLMYNGRALRYSTSQASYFMDKQSGDVLTTYLSIENGTLFVPKSNAHLQKFLAIHPDLGIVFKEFNPVEESKKAFDEQTLKVDAHILSRQIDSASLFAIASLMCKDYNETQDTYTVKRSLHNEIEANPRLFIKLANDPALKLKGIGKTAVNRGFLRYENYRFLDENEQVICEPNRNENEYDALASYFGSTEGRQLYEYLSRKIES